MRVNVYAEELHPLMDEEGERVFFHHKQAEGTDFEHHAVRMLFSFRHKDERGKIRLREIHTNGKKPDDDTPAVTFWYSNETERGYLIDIFRKALEVLDAAEAKYPQ